MKTSLSRNYLPVAAAVTLALAAGGWPQNSAAQTPPAPDAGTSVAPVTPVAPPPNIVPGSPYAEVVRLTQAGVDQSIVMTYVTNATSLFNLDSGKIIYLTDLGAPNELVTAMMQHDQQLQQQFAATQAAPPASATTPPPAEAVPAPAPANVTEVAPPPAPVTVDYFYTSLSPYGSWVVINGYGRCWRPTVCVYNSGWQPYCDNGYWVYSDCGWYWASSYAWGATFHYGRWFRDASIGWCWYPDSVWAPSWVTWRYSNNYCGWAPLPPHTAYQAGVGFVYNGGNVSVGFGFGLGANCYTFVPTPYFCNPHPRHYCVAPAQVTQVYNNTTVINNYNFNNHTIVNHGIGVENIATASRTRIDPVPVHQINNTYVQGGQNQRYNHPSNGSGGNHPGSSRDFGSPLRSPGSPQGYASQPDQNRMPGQNAPSRYNPVPDQSPSRRGYNASTPPQNGVPSANYHSPMQPVLGQMPPVNRNNPGPHTPSHYGATPGQPQLERNPAGVAAPQYPVPVAGYHQPTPVTPAQTPVVNHGNPNSQWQPAGTPRNVTTQNNYHPASQPSAPAYVPAPSPPGGYSHPPGGYQGGYQQSGGGHYGNNGNHNWPGQ